MLFPISDDDRALDGHAWVTTLLLVANVLVFGLQLADPAVTYGWSVVPTELVSGIDLVNAEPFPEVDPAAEVATPADIPQRSAPLGLVYLTVFTAMFMHGGWGHIGGNMLYLWIFGDNVEHRFGKGRFLLFYLGSGVVATLVQVAMQPAGLIPNLGASGAIAGVLGAYLVLFPRNRVQAIFIIRVVTVPAVVVLGLWIVLQFVNQWGATAATEETGGVAYGAHIGGFLTGMALAVASRAMGAKERPSRLSGAMARDGSRRSIW